MVPSTLRSMNCPVYGLAWLPAQGRTCAVYGQTHVKRVQYVEQFSRVSMARSMENFS
jgi:hypothetical protein